MGSFPTASWPTFTALLLLISESAVNICDWGEVIIWGAKAAGPENLPTLGLKIMYYFFCLVVKKRPVTSEVPLLQNDVLK